MRPLPLLRAVGACAAAVLLVAGCASADAQRAEPAASPEPTPASSRAPSPSASPSPSSPSPSSSSPSPSRSAGPAPTPVVQAGDGRLVVVPGTGPVSGPGEPASYVVEVEGGLGIDAAAFAREVEQVLGDPRSWGGSGRRPVQRVDATSPDGPDFRVALASPATTDRLCAPLRTNGYFSCASGDRAVLNAARWLTGATAYPAPLSSYRPYLVNHEVGHVLGSGHVPCPGPGRPAPVMMQQTKGLDGCTPVSWPYP